MKKKIAILGSTGSIGENTVKIIQSNKKDFNVIFLSSNNNVKKLFKQSIKLKPKAVIIFNKEKYNKFKYKFSKRKIKVFNSFNDLKSSIIKKKIDYIMCAISGLAGLESTINSISSTKNIAIANKESIICAWNLIKKKLAKNKTNFIPVDSEHFSIWSLLQNESINNVEKIIITASGGPFLNYKLNKLKNARSKDAIKHPNWNMGKKISIDSATLMNKVFEIIEAQRIFNIDIKKFEILIHPKSYIHSIIKFINGQIKILAHDTDMKIPIFNSLYNNENKAIISKNINLQILNNLELQEVDQKKFPVIKILDKIPDNESLFETLLVTINDELVDLFLTKQVSFQNISKNLIKFLNLNVFVKYKRQKLNNLAQIVKLNKFVRLKTKTLSIL